LKRFLKKVLGVTILTCILIVPVYADQMEDVKEIVVIQPRFSNINVFQNTFDISSSGKASVTVYLNARNADEVTVVADL